MDLHNNNWLYAAARLLLILILFSVYHMTCAQTVFKSHAVMPKSQIAIKVKKTGLIRMTVNNVPIKPALLKLAKKLHFKVNMPVLAETPVSLSCSGTELREILNCLLENKANLAFRYHRKMLNNKSIPYVAEVWITPTATENQVAEGSLPTGSDSTLTYSASDSTAISPIRVAPDRTPELVEKAQSNDKSVKIDALNELRTAGHPNDPTVLNILEQSLADQDPEVRGQALSTLAQREGAAALPAIEQGLYDESEDVRIIAVQAINDDIALLQLAAKDSDEAVRSLASIKLKQLIQQNMSNQHGNE